jgi:hypothetical protein
VGWPARGMVRTSTSPLLRSGTCFATRDAVPSGSWGGQRLRMADFVTGREPTGGAIPPEGVHVSSNPSAGPGLSVESASRAPSSCFCSQGSALRDAAAEGGLSGGSVGAMDAGGRGMPPGAAWGREGVAKLLLLGGSGVTNPLPSTISKISDLGGRIANWLRRVASCRQGHG